MKERKAALEKKERDEQERIRRKRQEEANYRQRMEYEEMQRKIGQRIPKKEDHWYDCICLVLKPLNCTKPITGISSCCVPAELLLSLSIEVSHKNYF